MTNNPTIDGVSRELSIPLKITAQHAEDLLRFFDTCEDDQGYDVPKPRMKSLARAGLIRSTGFSRYEITDAGYSAVEKLCEPVDAPAVERQEPVEKVDHPNFLEFAICDTCAAESLCCEVAPNEHLCGGCYWAPINEKAHADQVAALQSTIARLEARIAELTHISEDFLKLADTPSDLPLGFGADLLKRIRACLDATAALNGPDK